MLKPLKKKKLYEEIVEQIIHLISSEQLKNGDKLPSERALAEQLAVARPTVREALRTLEDRGYIESKIGSGMYVRALSIDHLVAPMSEIMLQSDVLVEEILEMRLVLETEIAKLATVRHSEEDIKELELTLDEMKKDIENGGYGAEADDNFHIKIAEACRNKCILTLFIMCRRLLKKAIESVYKKPNVPQNSYKEHIEVLEAIKSNNPEKAALAIKKHIHNTNKRIQDEI